MWANGVADAWTVVPGQFGSLQPLSSRVPATTVHNSFANLEVTAEDELEEIQKEKDRLLIEEEQDRLMMDAMREEESKSRWKMTQLERDLHDYNRYMRDIFGQEAESF